jgi:hypothetical protein
VVSRRLILVVLLALASCRTEEPSTVTPPTGTPTGTKTVEAPQTTTEQPSPEENPFSPGPEFGAIGSTQVEQGAKYWAVYLAVGEEGAPELEQATDYLAGLGIESLGGELACDRGAADALGLSEDLMAVGVYFTGQAGAQRFAKKLPTPPSGIARVRTYCAD